MQHTDAQLIQRTLQGDQDAFSPLVKKYQKGVHALAWRKIGDFHIAQEITQDAFLRAYQKLGTLKNPNAFAGWLYVIVAHLCLDWIRKNRIPMDSLDTTDPSEVDKVSYSQYVTDQQKSEADETRREVVKQLLKKLPESERTVMTLHYLGEMTIKAISEFLGVSPNTVKSRLSRARNRLRKQEDVIRENLGSCQLPNQVAEHIMREVSRLTPADPATSKPMVPWAALGAAAVLVILMLGVGSQYLARFQKPYSFDALSEPTVEIVDAPIVIDTISKPDVRRRFGRSDVPSKSTGAGTQTSETNLRSTAQEDQRKFAMAQWTQGNAPPGGPVRDIFATSDGTVYALSKTGVYKFAADATAWTRINANIPISKSLMPMTEHRDTLYIVSTDAIFASADNGKTWNTLGPRPTGRAVGLIVIDTPQVLSSSTGITMYLALKNKGVFQSVDGGAQWHLLKDGMRAEIISTIAAVGETVFAGTEQGLYRFDSDVWKKLSINTSQAVCSLAVLGNNLYVGTGSDLLLKFTPMEVYKKARKNTSHSIGVFHSADLGASWTEITPNYKYSYRGPPAGITVLAVGETLMALGYEQFRSTDSGKTWHKFNYNQHWLTIHSLPVVAVNETTLYKVGVFGLRRTTDAGDSWNLFMDGMSGLELNDLVAFNNKLYANTDYEIYQSSDEGISWKKVSIDGRDSSGTTHSSLSRFIVRGNSLYFLLTHRSSLQIYRLSTEGDAFIPFQDVPIIEDKPISAERIGSSMMDEYVKTNKLVVSGDVFYMEYGRKLFKWKLGDPAWTNTGLVDIGAPNTDDYTDGFRVAASRETVYVGKRDGELFQSLDGGNNWRDVTPALPLHFSRFKDIVFSGRTLYVATDSGVLVSHTGEHWRVITDRADTRIVINQFAVEGTDVYGVGDTGAYRLESRGQWEQISSEVPEEIVDATIINNKLYGTTRENGMFYLSLEEEL